SSSDTAFCAFLPTISPVAPTYTHFPYTTLFRSNFAEPWIGGQLIMTTTHDVTEQVHPMLDIELTARITVIDANGTEVSDQRLPEVVDIIRQRSQRTGQSIVTLAVHHREDSFYEPTVWQLSGHKFAESNASPKNAHYSLTYDKWQVLSTDGQL